MASVLNQAYFQDEEAAYEMLESIVWPTGVVCPHCGETKRTSKMQGAATRPGLRKCYACRKQFRVTVGTVFEASHIKLHQWLQAAYLMCSSKKGISSNQMARTLGVTLKTGWFVTHRLREAMKDGSIPLPPMGGAGMVVEVDETFIGQKREKPEKARGYAHKHAVLRLIERGAGSRPFHVSGTAAADLLPIIKAHVATGTQVMTDDAGQTRISAKHFPEHEVVRHAAGEWGRGSVHTNTVEGFYSVFKRGMKVFTSTAPNVTCTPMSRSSTSGTTIGSDSGWTTWSEPATRFGALWAKG